MSRNPKIYVETMGYYQSDSEFKATLNIVPKQLNWNRRFFENPDLQMPFVNVNVEIPKNNRIKEHNLASLLDYLSQNGWPDGEKPNFVTHKQLLQVLASSSDAMILQVVRVDGIIFLYRDDESFLASAEYSWIFKHYLTKTTDGEPFESSGRIRKGVFKASFDMGPGRKRAYVLYAGKIDAIDEDDQHFEVKVVSGNGIGGDYFWKNQSLRIYWQSFFGNVVHVILGTRTGKQNRDRVTKNNNYPEFSVYKVEKMNLKKLYFRSKETLDKNHSGKSFEDGFEEIRDLLEQIKNIMREDGDGFVFSRAENSREWMIRRDDKAVAGFRNQILNNIPL